MSGDLAQCRKVAGDAVMRVPRFLKGRDGGLFSTLQFGHDSPVGIEANDVEADKAYGVGTVTVGRGGLASVMSVFYSWGRGQEAYQVTTEDAPPLPRGRGQGGG